MRKSSFLMCIPLAGIVFAGTPLLLGSSFHVAPVRIELSDRKPTTVLQVGNEGDEPVTVQVRVLGWQQHGNDDVYPETNEIFISPPIAKIAPHSKQLIRIALRHKEVLIAERAYRVFIEEVPGPVKPDFTGVNTLLQVSVPIYRKPANPSAAARLSWAADFTPDGFLRLTVSNAGEIHFLIHSVSVTSPGKDPVTQKSVQCVLAGSKREWIFRDESLKRVTHITLEAVTDSGELHEEITPHSSE